MTNSSKRYNAFGPDAEVLGQAMLAFVTAINYSNFQAILKQHGLGEIDPEAWYPQQIWLDVFNDIAESPNGSADLVSIGMKIIDNAVTPPGFNQLPFLDIMRAFGNGSYEMNNRGKDIGYIKTEVMSDRHVVMHDLTPYPDDFVYGAYYAAARRFLPRGTQFTVSFDPNILRRDEGGDETVVHIEW